MNRELCLTLSSQPTIDQKGNINNDCFNDTISAHWSENEQNLLMRGIKKFGVGNYEKIRKHLIPSKGVFEIRLRTYMLLGTSNIDEFIGLKDFKKISEIMTKNLNSGKIFLRLGERFTLVII
ncbi:hypothetical protein SteCoe_33690 [Stentor coeruleus]|uniref:Myb-like domain-containing protein n=1 Tax=Stentor coeruleus TaxID=5963 RepID=A0A1R2AWJ6_9CILI|nr:hypothetical protein SteCoe_33690 [Stentor coeruleus]